VPDAAVVVVEVPPHLRQVQHGGGPAARPARRAGLPGGGGERFPPEAVPGVRYGPAHGHGAVSLYVVDYTPSSYRRDGSISRPAGQEKARSGEKPLDRGVPQEARTTGHRATGPPRSRRVRDTTQGFPLDPACGGRDIHLTFGARYLSFPRRTITYAFPGIRGRYRVRSGPYMDLLGGSDRWETLRPMISH